MPAIDRSLPHCRYEAVLRSDLSLRETFAFFDHDGDGRVTFEEFVTVCDECDLGITPHQAKQLLREIAHSSDGKGVDIADFIARFQVLYVGASGRGLQVRNAIIDCLEPLLTDLKCH